MAITLNKLPATALGTASYSVSGNNVTFTYNPAGNWKVDYWNIKSYGYEELEYLETDGTAYINLGDHVSNTLAFNNTSLPIRKQSKSMITDMHFSIRPGATVSTATRYIYGCRGSADSWTLLGLNNRYLYSSMAKTASDAEARLPGTGDGVVHKIHQLSGIFRNNRRIDIIDMDDSIENTRLCLLGTVDQTGETGRWANFGTGSNIYLFTSSNSSGTPATIINGLRIHDFTTKLKYAASNDGDRKFVLKPVRRGDGVLGMYDIYTGKFYTNAAASGSFIAGPSKGAYISAKVKGNPMTIYHNSSKNLVVEACTYDSTLTTGYVEYAPGTTAETSSLCFIRQNVFNRPSNIGIKDSIKFKGRTNGGTTQTGSTWQVYYAKNDGYLVGSAYTATDASAANIWTMWCDDVCYYSTGVAKGSSIQTDFVPFKKGDLVVFGSGSNYANLSDRAIMFYV